MATGTDQVDTDQRIVNVAIELFSQNGYRGTSIASICERANVNLAAVNYHFQSKLELYLQVWRVALLRETETNPFDGGVLADAPAEDRLRGRIRSLVQRFVRPDAPSELAMLIIHELADPTDPAVDAVRREAIQPPHAAMRALVREMLGELASDRDVLFTTMSIFTPVFGLGLQQQAHHRRDRWPRDKRHAGHEGLPGAVLRCAIEADGGFDALVEHITDFALAGIAAVRRRVETQGRTGC